MSYVSVSKLNVKKCMICSSIVNGYDSGKGEQTIKLMPTKDFNVRIENGKFYLTTKFREKLGLNFCPVCGKRLSAARFKNYGR